MSFADRTPQNIAALAVQLSLTGLQDNAIAAALNSMTGPGAGTLPHVPILSSEFMGDVQASEYLLVDAATKATLRDYLSTGSIDIGDPSMQSFIAANFPANTCPNSRAALTGKATQPASPFELRFGRGLETNSSEISTARPFFA